jgi:acetylornithine deacetylase
MDHALLPDTLALLRTLIAFDTRSSQPNIALIQFVQQYLARWNIECHLSGDIAGGKANLYATIGPSDRPGICLSGHTDVVPAQGQPWSVPAFELTTREDRVLGRGTADMKGFIAAVLACVPRFVAAGGSVPIHLALSYDEEIGCRGVPHLLAELQRSAVKPLACIIGEPTSMRVGVAHKGKRAYRCCARGLAGHSALPHLGVNAVEFAAELVTHLRGMGQRLRTEGAQDPRFVPPYSTVHTGRLSGGIALNVIPDRAEVEFEIRNLPGDDIEQLVGAVRSHTDTQIVAQMQQTAADSGIDWEELVAYPGLSDDTRSGWLQQLACDLSGHTDRVTLSFGTEGGLFQQLGIPTVVCGPGSIEQAHKADEFVALDQLSQCLRFLERLTDRLPAALDQARSA